MDDNINVLIGVPSPRDISEVKESLSKLPADKFIDTRRGASNRGVTSVSDGGTIAHGCFTTPAVITITNSIADEFASVTAIGATTFTVALRKRADGTAGTPQTIYWNAEVYT